MKAHQLNRHRVAGFVALTVSTYVLSLGPAEWLWRHKIVSEKLLRIVYWPARFIDGSPLAGPVEWYCDLWVGRSGTDVSG